MFRLSSIAFLMLLATLGCTGLTGTGSFQITTEEKACQVDADCTLISAGCCGCTSGGTQAAIASKNYESANARLASSCAAVSCIQVISDDPSCSKSAACVDNQCTLK